MKTADNLSNESSSPSYDSTKGYTFSFADAGYYFVKNTGVPTGTNKTFSDCIVEVVGEATVNPKSVFPTVAKQVKDELVDADDDNPTEWGETADHAINEEFQFRLIARIPNDPLIDTYEKYKLVFHDTMDAGITFDKIVSVQIIQPGKGSTDSEGNATDLRTDVTAYTYAASSVSGETFTVTIEDAKAAVTDKDLKGASVEVVYEAHLNENAVTVDTPGQASEEKDNDNSVYLEYSNYPHIDANGDNSPEMGRTPTDTVHVFTYSVPNFKYYMEGTTQRALPTAGFRLYGDSQCGTEIKLTKQSDGVYCPTKAGESTADEMFPDSYGNFTIKGLDVGTYYLKETNVPTGYNGGNVMTIKVDYTQNHKEDTSGNASVTYGLTVDNKVVSTNNIENRQGATLPTTGSIGTTIFYVLGSILVIGAVVLLVSKKRMNDVE